MELVDRYGKLQVRVQPRAGSVHSVREAKMDGTHLKLEVSRGTIRELEVTRNQLTGVQMTGDAMTARIAGVRAPELKRSAPKAWTNAEPQLNGKTSPAGNRFPPARPTTG